MRSSGGKRPREKYRSAQNTETFGPQSADNATASLRMRSSTCADNPAVVTSAMSTSLVTAAEPRMGQTTDEISASEARYWVAGRPHHRRVTRPNTAAMPAAQPVTHFCSALDCTSNINRRHFIFSKIAPIYFLYFAFPRAFYISRCSRHAPPSSSVKRCRGSRLTMNSRRVVLVGRSMRLRPTGCRRQHTPAARGAGTFRTRAIPMVLRVVTRQGLGPVQAA